MLSRNCNPHPEDFTNVDEYVFYLSVLQSPDAGDSFQNWCLPTENFTISTIACIFFLISLCEASAIEDPV